MKLFFGVFVFLSTILIGSVGANAQFSGGNYFDWLKARCFEFTPQRVRIQEVHDQYCRFKHPTHFDWHKGRCYEFTPRGYRIQEVHEQYCRFKDLRD